MNDLEKACEELRLASIVLDAARTNTINALRELAVAKDEAIALLNFAAACHEKESEALTRVLLASDMARVAWLELGHE